MARINVPFANGFYESESLPLSAQQCINCYPNFPQAPALNNESLFGTPGITQVATVGNFNFVNRGAHVADGKPYFVQGGTLYRLNEIVTSGVVSYTTTSLGSITGTDRVWMADNGTQLLILVPGATSTGYILTLATDTLSTISDVDFNANGEPQTVVYIDGYFLLTTDSKKFIISALNDGTSYNALDFGSAEADPDDIVAPVVFKNQLFIGGSETFEGFQNRPSGADFPFVRTGLYLSKGVSAKNSVIVAQDTFMFIGAGTNESPAVWGYTGNTVQKISTTAIDSLLQDLTQTQIQDSFAWSYAQKGAYFVGFTLPTTTIVYDTISGKWHERQSRVENAGGNPQTQRYRANSIVQAYGVVLCGDSEDGRIGLIDEDVYEEYSGTIVRTFSPQVIQNNMDSFSIPRIELTVESGVGDTTTTNPLMSLELSKDGGKTFDYLRTRSLGGAGEFNKRLIWRKNGRFARFMVMRFTFSEKVKFAILQLAVDAI